MGFFGKPILDNDNSELSSGKCGRLNNIKTIIKSCKNNLLLEIIHLIIFIF
jgi:hypothetical protein